MAASTIFSIRKSMLFILTDVCGVSVPNGSGKTQSERKPSLAGMFAASLRETMKWIYFNFISPIKIVGLCHCRGFVDGRDGSNLSHDCSPYIGCRLADP